MALTKPSHSQDVVRDPAQNNLMLHHAASAGYANKPLKGSTHTALKGLLNFGIDKPSLSLPKFFLIFFFSVKDNCIYTINY